MNDEKNVDSGVENEGEELQKMKVETERFKDGYMDAGPGVLSIELPCGHIDEDDNLYRTIVVKEMTGHEEDILMGKGSILSRLNAIISNCTVRLGSIEDRATISGAVEKMTAADRLAVMIAIRRVSLGDFFDVKVQCPNPKCKAILHPSVDLSEVEIMSMPDPMVRQREDTVSTGTTVKWHVMSAEDEGWLTSMKKGKWDELSLAMLTRIESINGEPLDRSKKTVRRAVKILKALSMRDRIEIRSLFEKNEGSVDTDVEFVCPDCEHEWTADMEIGQASFFFPSEV